MSLGVIPIRQFSECESTIRIARNSSLSLTDQEIIAFGNTADLASGHAYHELPPALAPVVSELPSLWRAASQATPLDWEDDFKVAFARLTGLLSIADLRFCRPCPTASNSIDLAATLLRAQGRRTLLAEPTFDNLALLTARRGVPLAPISESLLFDPRGHGLLADRLDRDKIGALFIVSPTNPTSRCMDAETLAQLCDICEQRDVLMVLDTTFRLFNRNPFDDLAVLLKSGVSFVVFEDTGKTFPTLDTKASLIYCSDDIADELNNLYNEVYLCSSGLNLALLTRVFELALSAGMDATVWSIVDQRRMELRAALVGTGLAPARETFHSVIGVEWLSCDEIGMSDIDVCDELGKLGIAAVTGRQFFWASQDDPRSSARVRLSMMKPRKSFDWALSRLERLRSVGGLGAGPNSEVRLFGEGRAPTSNYASFNYASFSPPR